jgi:hypothetical protein
MPTKVVKKEPENEDYHKRRQGTKYIVTEEEKQYFKKNGYVILRCVISEEEMKELEAVINLRLKKICVHSFIVIVFLFSVNRSGGDVVPTFSRISRFFFSETKKRFKYRSLFM